MPHLLSKCSAVYLAVNLATLPIGGTMNIINGSYRINPRRESQTELGAGGFKKLTANYNTGLINDKMAFSATVVRKTGDGIIQG